MPIQTASTDTSSCQEERWVQNHSQDAGVSTNSVHRGVKTITVCVIVYGIPAIIQGPGRVGWVSHASVRTKLPPNGGTCY